MLRLYNTLTRKKEIFKPMKNKTVGMYSCGPTVYNYAHIGNLRSYVFADILKRTLLYNGYSVKHVINLTDVGHLTSDSDIGEDKMEKGSRREGKSAWEIAEFYIKAFYKDIKNLNILPADVWPRPTEHIREQIVLIKTLEKKGYTYIIENDGVYFDTSKLKDYGKLARLDISGLRRGFRVKFQKGKRNATDFALWKFSPKDQKRQMEWDSPWGVGFPGWHIECSAMSMKYLGKSFDIHTGGIDHIPVHHTNEIAQAEAATGKRFVNFWLHNEFVKLGKEKKMAKSGNNFIILNTLIKKGFDPLAYRYWLLTAHYRSPVEFSYIALKASQKALEGMREFIYNSKKGKIGCAEYESNFFNAINDDLDTPKALAICWRLIKDKKISEGAKKKSLLQFDQVLGLGLDKLKKRKIHISRDVQKLLEERERLREQKKYDQADKIRKSIEKYGYKIEDTPKGPKISLNK